MKRIEFGKNGAAAEPLRQTVEVPVREAAFPMPFPQQLEFNPPVHGTWNIVHIGMQLPEAHQIYVCGINCMRGVVLTAAEMNLLHRFSCVTIDEKDILDGTLEDATADGVTDVLNKLPSLPPAVMVFTVCTHHFLGCDLDYIYKKLEQRFPQVRFLRCYMDPLLQKEGPTPDQKLRIEMYRVLRGEADKAKAANAEKHEHAAAVHTTPFPEESEPVKPADTSAFAKQNDGFFAALLGNNVPLEPDNDLSRMLQNRLVQPADCETYRDFCAMGEAGLFLSTVPNGNAAAADAAKRLGKKHLHLPMCFSYERIRSDLQQLAAEVESVSGSPLPQLDYEEEIRRCDEAIGAAQKVIGNTPVVLDYASHPTPLGLARFLLEHHFHVMKIYLNVILSEEEADFLWLRENAPELILAATIQPAGRILSRRSPQPVLAIGQHAAWYNETPHFVNMVEGGGLYGFAGIRRLAALLQEAMEEEKDLEDIVPRKGLGCESCV